MKFKQISELISAAKNIAIISHKNPDGDTIGSNLAFRYYFQSIGKNVGSFCVDKPKNNYAWMRDIDKFSADFDSAKFDLIMSVDTSSHGMLAFENVKPHLNIDHHFSNTRFGDINIIDDKACSTSFVVYKIFKHFSWKITHDIATALMTGLYYDTGSFMHSNTDSETLRVAADLARLGADKSKIVKEMFKTMSIPQIKLWGRILEKIKTTDKGVTVSVVTTDDLTECGATQEEVDRVVDYLNANEEGRFCVLLVEGDKGIVKGSARTRREEIDLSGVCGLLGGGGHRKAGGFVVPGKIIEEEIIKIIK